MLSFDFLQPETQAEALRMLSDHDEDACVFAGGTALLLAMRQRMIAPAAVVSLDRLTHLRGIAILPDGSLRIGALTRHAEIARDPAVAALYPVLSQVFGNLANPQVRNQGTVGGNLCYADPATDPPSCLVALGAQVGIAGPMGERLIPMSDFLVDFFTTALEPGEILTEIRLPPPRPGFVAHYRRHLRTPAEHRPVANVALAMQDAGGIWTDLRLVIGASVPVAQRMGRAEDFLTGRKVTPEVAAEAAALVAADLRPVSDGRGSAAFRTQVVRAAVRRIVLEAAGIDWREAA